MFVLDNGRLIESSKPLFTAMDRALQFGDGVFTTIRVAEGVVENIGKHLLRLKRHAQVFSFNDPVIPEEWIRDLVFKNRAEKGVWRLKIMLLRSGLPEPFFFQKADARVIMTLRPVKPVGKLPWSLCLYPEPVSKPLAKVKALGSTERLWLKQFALQNGCHEVLTTYFGGILLEGAASNLFWVEGDTLKTPSDKLPLLWGTYLESILEAAQRIGYQVFRVKETLRDLSQEAHVFFCNSLIGICPITNIEGRLFKRGKEMENRFLKAVRQVIIEDALRL